MSSQQGKWREDQVLVICPGSQTTMAQLGVVELSPPTKRIPTRMFKDPETGQFRSYHTYKRKKEDGEDEWVEDHDSVEGAIYPMVAGRIENMPAFLAFLDFVHSEMTTTFHNTPILLMGSPQWTRGDWEDIARYIFEKTKTPALCLVDNAVAAQYGVKWPHLTVVDIGFEKVDVTCFHDHLIVGHKSLGFPSPDRAIAGGEVFTQKLHALLKDKGFTHDMAEKLKRSPLCEVLPYAPERPERMELPTEGASTAGPALPLEADAPTSTEAPKPALADGADEDDGLLDGKPEEEGVLDVANIVTSGNVKEVLAKKEKEKAERAKAKKHKAQQEAEAAAARPARLPNSKRVKAVFHYEELVHEDVQVPVSNGVAQPAANSDATAPEGASADGATNASADGAALPFANQTTTTVTERRTKRVEKEIEVGLERFTFAERDAIDRIAGTIYRAIQGIPDMYKRPACWDNILFVGNGARLRGLKENIMQTLNARYLVSPSSATIFTSELPSNMGTPTGTGSQTPTGSFTGQLPTSSSVNPLLQAATTASASLGAPGQLPLPGGPGSTLGEAGPSHHSHAQAPTSIKLAQLPTYLAEWTKNGYEEAMFLGSLVAARLAYCISLDANSAEAQKGMSLTRTEYNDHGPKAILTHHMMRGAF